MTFFFAGEAATSQQFRESENPLILLSRFNHEERQSRAPVRSQH